MKVGRNQKSSKGITLIALVITVIVLLILAGVSVATLTGENGILTRAQDAEEQTEKKGLKEEIELAVGSDNIGDKVDGNGNLEEELNKINGATVSKVKEYTYYVERDGNGYTVYEDGTIEEGKLDVWDGVTIEKPEVDENNNWHIYTAAQMKFYADYTGNRLTDEEKTEANMPEITRTTTVYLENNIDMGARQENGELISGTQWESARNQYSTFEGNNHYITGIYAKGDSSVKGIFSTNSGIIQNLTIKNSYIETSFQCVGGIVGSNIAGIRAENIINCHNINTTVKSTMDASYAGGIVGINTMATIENCTNTGEISGKNAVGGIIGSCGMGSYAINGMKDCVNYGKVSGRDAVGGIAGGAQSGATVGIMNCGNFGEILGEYGLVGGIIGGLPKDSSINNSYNEGKIIGKANYVGGIAGRINTGSSLSNSYNKGTIEGDYYNVGGIVGISFGTIENAYNLGEIHAKVGQAGGIAGQIGTECEGNIRNCYNEGTIISDNEVAGGIVGWTSATGTSGTIENNYNKGTVKGATQVGGIIGRNAGTFVVMKCYNKGKVEGNTIIGSVIGEQLTGNDNLSKLYYLNTLNIGGVNGQDIVDKNILGVSDDINSYEEFLTWIESK